VLITCLNAVDIVLGARWSPAVVCVKVSHVHALAYGIPGAEKSDTLTLDEREGHRGGFVGDEYRPYRPHPWDIGVMGEAVGGAVVPRRRHDVRRYVLVLGYVPCSSISEPPRGGWQPSPLSTQVGVAFSPHP
jgi:hypothetical protein